MTHIHIPSIRLAEDSGPAAQRTATAAGAGFTGQQAGRAGQRHGCKRERVSLVTLWCTGMVKIINELCDFTFQMHCFLYVQSFGGG